MDNVYFKTTFDFIHVLATVIWFGGMFTNFLVIKPVLAGTVDPATASRLTGAMLGRLRVLVYGAIVVLGVTGIPLKIVDPHYTDIVNLDHAWGIASFCKHVLYCALVVMAFLNFQIIAPRLARAAAAGDQAAVDRWRRPLEVGGKLAVSTALAVLVLSSLMRNL